MSADMSEHYQVSVEDANVTEFTEHLTEKEARRNFRWAVDKLRPGERATLTRVTLLDAAEGEEAPLI
jgi:hypothetical protein